MSRGGKKRETAAEFLARLRRDPEWVRQDAERERKRQAVEAELKEDVRPLLDELAQVGHAVSTIWDLVNTREKYPAAIPVLIKHLRLPYHPRNREGIARALGVAEARGAPAREILAELQRRADEPKNEARWALANALTTAGDASMAEQIEAMLADTRFEDLRAILQLVLKKIASRSRSPRK